MLELVHYTLRLIFNFLFLSGQSYPFYAYRTEYLPWQSALSICEGMGMQLAYVTTATENAALAEILTEPTWIGLRYDKQWAWSSGTDVGFTAWAPGEPNNFTGDEYCAEMEDQEWNDTPCDYNMISAFACRE